MRYAFYVLDRYTGWRLAGFCQDGPAVQVLWEREFPSPFNSFVHNAPAWVIVNMLDGSTFHYF